MLDVSEAVKQAYINGNAQTEIFLTVTKNDGSTVVYDPENILSGSVSIVESLCSSEAFDISRVEKNQLTFTLFNITEGIKGLQNAQVVAKQRVTLPDETVVDIPLGTYTIVEAMNDGDYLYKCTCYDSTMYKLDGLIDDWWKNLRFPITLRNLAISMFEHLECPYDIPAEFNNHNYVVPAMNTVFEGVTGTEILGYIQEIVGGFFKANRFGVITLRVPVPTESGLYPHIGLYPHTNLYPRRSSSGFGVDGEVGVGDWNYPQIVGDLKIGDYDVKRVTKVQIRGTEDDIGIIAGGGTNTYVIQGNPLLFNLTDESGRQIAENILSAVSQIAYKPFSGKFMAQPYIEVGDMAKITTYEGKDGVSPIFQRTLSGARLAFDTFQCLGLEEREQVSSINRKITTVNQRTHEVINTVDELRSTVTQVENTVNTHTTEIEQNANEINLSARRSGIFNLLVNSDFSNQNNPTQGWQWYSSLTGTEYTYDENFVGTSLDYNKIEDGSCLKLTFGNSQAFSYFYQDLKINSPITETLQVQVSHRLVTWDNTATVRLWVRTFDASGAELVSKTTENIPVSSVCKCTHVAFPTLKTDLGGATVTTLRVGLYVGSITGTNVIEINHFLATFTQSDVVLPYYSWTNYASKDVISQINIQPTGVTIQGEKIDIKGITTFSSGSSGTTVIDGGTVNVTNLNASNITSGSLSAGYIKGGTLTLGGANNVNGQLIIKNASNTTIGQWDKDGINITGGTITSPTISSGSMYWYKDTAYEASIVPYTAIYEQTAYRGIKLEADDLYLYSPNGVISLRNSNITFDINPDSTQLLYGDSTNGNRLVVASTYARMAVGTTGGEVRCESGYARVRVGSTGPELRCDSTSSYALMRVSSGGAEFRCNATYARMMHSSAGAQVRCDSTYTYIKTPDYGDTTPKEHKVVWRSVSGIWVLALA